MNLYDLLKENGIELFENGNQGRFKARCVFHEGDNEPSLVIYPNETYWCFACEKWGDSFQFLIDYKGMSPKEAMDYLGEDYIQPRSEKSKVIKIRDVANSIKYLWDVSQHYYQFLLNTPGALNYLEKIRGLSRDTIAKYRLGYTDGSVLPQWTVWEQKLGTELGIVNLKGYEIMSHRITIPNILEDGQCDFIMGRTVTNTKPKYLGTRIPKPIYGFWEFRYSPVLFLVEGQFDRLTLCQWGFPAIAVSGTHLKAPEQALLRGKQLVYLPDVDTAGEAAGRSIKAAFKDDAHILDYSSLGVIDINELSTTYEDGRERFIDLLIKEFPWTAISLKTILNPSSLNSNITM